MIAGICFWGGVLEGVVEEIGEGRNGVVQPPVAIVSGDVEKLIEAHQQERRVPTRAEIKARFDQAVVRDAPARNRKKHSE
jgi:hypothetical protein